MIAMRIFDSSKDRNSTCGQTFAD